MKLLWGRIALITGAGSGIGRSTAKVLAQNGATIIATDRHLENAQETVKSLDEGEHIAYHMNVTDCDSVIKVLDQAISRFKRPPKILVNSAGITRDNFILNMKENEFDEVLNVNLKGSWLVIQKVAHTMIDYGIQGTVVNVSSVISRLGNMGQANYAASKAGTEALTKVAANEFGKYNIRVNCVVPGFTETPMTAKVPEKVRELIRKQIPMRRFGQPEEIAEVIAFLSAEKSSFVNGSCWEVTGGL